MPDNPQDKALTPVMLDIPGAAKLLSCKIWTIRKLIRSGELPAKKVGRNYLTPRTALEEFAQQGLQRGGLTVS